MKYIFLSSHKYLILDTLFLKD